MYLESCFAGENFCIIVARIGPLGKQEVILGCKKTFFGACCIITAEIWDTTQKRMTGANEGFLRAVETQSECGGGEAGWLNTDFELDHKK